jgi:hypothetical protein
MEDHPSLSPRIGTNLAISREANQGLGEPGAHNPEDTIIRLSDGTPLFRPGALWRGVVLSSANVQLWTIYAALKCRGFEDNGQAPNQGIIRREEDTARSLQAPVSPE